MRSTLIALLALAAVLPPLWSDRLAAADPERTRPTFGLHTQTPAVFALVHARIVTQAGHELLDASLVIRHGVIDSVGTEISIPDDAVILDMNGKSIYPGLIDAYSEHAASLDVGSQSGGYWNPAVRPQLRMSEQLSDLAKSNQTWRRAGFTSRLVAPDDGVVRGVSALIATVDDPAEAGILADAAALHLRLTVPRQRGPEGYPSSPMGAVALARQSFYDARWYDEVWRVYRSQTAVDTPETNDALAAMRPYVADNDLVVLDGLDEQYFLRADQFAREFGLRAVILGSGLEYRRLDKIGETRRAVILPLKFPKPPNVATPAAASAVSLQQLMHWDLAPENPARLHAAGITFALTSRGLDKPGDFLPALRRAVKRGLPRDAALRAATENAAMLFGVNDRVGKITPGLLAHLIVTDGDLFDDQTKIVEAWVGRHRERIESDPQVDLTGKWRLVFEHPSQPVPSSVLEVTGKPAKPQATLRRETDDERSLELKHLKLEYPLLTATADAEWFQREGTARFSATVLTEAESHLLIGRCVLPDGEVLQWRGERIADEAEDQDEDKDEDKDEAASFAVNYPLGAFGRSEPPVRPDVVIFRGATVWTCGDQGILSPANVVVEQGRITQVTTEDVTIDGATEVDCQGLHLTPGIIDCHSHMATDGGVNEGTQAITSEVRIGDFIDATDITIYRQLAGGVTAANILHGSANPIGGQNQVIKLRWGAASEELKFKEAPAGIKFALGENVKRSNFRSSSGSRYPESRMGVEQIIRDAILAARQYQDRWSHWRSDHQGLPPRYDLELEAISEIVQGERWIHCHSYRQDEILAFLRTLEEFQIQVGTLQHILEGYKVAEALRRHGAMASAFSDWWAYKIEVYDAIPYNGALMHQQGVVVSFNSDDHELARHLNQEAGKAMKYGGIEATEALKFVTLNPAKQLRVDSYVGSIETGKHADLVLWSGPPMSNFSRCEQTWIDGCKYFDRSADLADRATWNQMRHTLIQKILDSGVAMQSASETSPEHRLLWPRVDEYCAHRSLR